MHRLTTRWRERPPGWSNNNVCLRACANAHERAVERASEFDFGEVRLLTCSAEDLVVFKSFAGRERNWADIESIAMRQAGHLDWTLIYNELAPLAELRGGNALITRLQELQKS